MLQNVKYDSLTGKVYEELGCPTKSNKERHSPKTDAADVSKNVKNDELSTNVKETENLSHIDQRPPDYSHHYSSYHDYYGQQVWIKTYPNLTLTYQILA